MYPGLAVAQALRDVGDPEIVYVGGIGGIEEQLAKRAAVPFVGIPAGGVHGLAPRVAMQNLLKSMRGTRVAYRLGRRQRPSALFATGGYASVPVALAARLLRVPIVVYLPDIEPGLAVRFIARLATKVAVTVEDSRRYFARREVVATGYPVRAEFHDVDRKQARDELQLKDNAPVLLVMGGSRGARSLNRAVASELEQLLEMAQVVHLSGELDSTWVGQRRDMLPERLKRRYHAVPYLHEMGYALAAADLALCRAGASTLGEMPFFGLPAVLVPYPHAWRYQRVNAEWLAKRGAAVTLQDEQLQDKLLPTLRELLTDRARLERMGNRAQALSQPDAAARLAQALITLV